MESIAEELQSKNLLSDSKFNEKQITLKTGIIYVYKTFRTHINLYLSGLIPGGEHRFLNYFSCRLFAPLFLEWGGGGGCGFFLFPILFVQVVPHY